MKKFNITVVKSQNPANLTKIICQTHGKLDKSPIGNITAGTATLRLFNLQSFADYLNNIAKNECVILGKYNHSDEVEIVGHDSLENIPAKKVCRTLNNFSWNDGYQLVYFDYDGNGVDEEFTPEQFIDEIDKAIPGFKDIDKVVKYSSSANIYNKETNELVSTSNGFHIYFLVDSSELIS